MEVIYTVTTWILPLFLCIVIHEMAHGYAALYFGDYTAKVTGRLSFNPKEHIDPIGTLLVPGVLLLVSSPFLFGWAKPVPIDFRNLHHPKRDMGFVAAAGPAANIILAIVFILIGRIGVLFLSPDTVTGDWFFANIQNGVMLSLILAVFNLLPVLPLDGGRILVSVLPLKYSMMYQQTERYGFFILIGLLFILPVIGIDIVGWFMNLVYPMVLKFVALFI